MLEYLNFFLLCSIFALILYLYIRTKKYFLILKMAEELIGNLGYGTPQSDTKHKTLLECVLTGNSKLYLAKVYTEEKIKEVNEEEVEKLFNNYEAKLSGQMVKSLGHSIINMYSVGACSALGITNQDALSEDLENDPFALQRFTCELYYTFGSFLAPLSVGIITSRHYLLSERNKNGERTSGTSGTNETRDNKNGGDEKQPSKLEGPGGAPLGEVIGAVITVGVLGFWFGIGAALGSKVVNNLEELISR